MALPGRRTTWPSMRWPKASSANAWAGAPSRSATSPVRACRCPWAPTSCRGWPRRWNRTRRKSASKTDARPSRGRRSREGRVCAASAPHRNTLQPGIMSVMADTSSGPLTRADVARQAWPIILANAAVPALGLVDTAVIGHFGSATELGGLALGALLFNFVYWSFGFLRMGTTGFVAQASGAGDEAEVRAALGRAVLMGAILGAVLIALQRPIAALYLGLMDGSAAVEEATAGYFQTRIWGAPAALTLFACSGLLIGLGRSRELLAVQLLLNGLNAGLDVWFAGYLGMGVRGIGVGTAIAEWLTCAVAL